MKDIKEKAKMKEPKVHNPASRAPKDMKAAMVKMREQTNNPSEEYESAADYGANAVQEQSERAFNTTVNATDSAIHKVTEKAKQPSSQSNTTSYTDDSTYKGGKNHAEKQAESTFRSEKVNKGSYSQTPKTQPKNTVSSVKQGLEKSAKTTERTVKAGSKTVKTVDRGVKTTKKTADTAKKSAKASKEAAKKTAQGMKALGRAIVRGVKALIRGIRNLIIAIAAGGWVAVIIILFIAVIAFILMSAFGVFTADEITPDKPMSTMVHTIDIEYEVGIEEKIMVLSNGDFDEVKVVYTGDADGDSASVNNWNDVIAVYAVMTTTDETNPMAVVTVNLENEQKLRDVFNTMNYATFDDRIVAEDYEVENEDGTTSTETKLVRYIYVTLHAMDYEEAAEHYGFTEYQIEILEEMMLPEYNKYYAELIGIDLMDGADLTQIISNLPPNSKGSEVVKAAVEKLGAPYVLGAKGDKKFDCSGLAYWAINQVDPALGDIMYTNAAGQAKYCYNNNKVVGESELLPGDLVFWQNLGCSGCHRWKEIHHVGIYMGEGKVIEASSSKGRVVIRDLWSSSGYPLFMYGRPY